MIIKIIKFGGLSWNFNRIINFENSEFYVQVYENPLAQNENPKSSLGAHRLIPLNSARQLVYQAVLL